MFGLPGIALWSSIAAACLVCLCLLCRFVFSAKLACAALSRQGRSAIIDWMWRSACLLASFLPTSIVLVVLAVLVDYTAKKNVPAGGIGLILAVAVGVVGNHVDRQVSGGFASYWERIHDSLHIALSTAPITQPSGYPACQLTRFNTTHTLIHDREGRRDAVLSILREPVCTRVGRCHGHGG
jgi:uncharacterized membrane protein YeaQ/YmgE (transglycosylase-associated protein family)